MKAKEFINESAVADEVSHTLPATFALPGLQNQDAYLQYRFGITLASARAQQAGEVEVDDESEFGENMIVVAKTKEEEEQLDLALSKFGGSGPKKQLATAKSSEPPDTYTKSPTAPQYSRKLRKE